MIVWTWTFGSALAADPVGTAAFGGEVLEFGSGLPLVGADVAIGELHAATDATGRFRIDVPEGEVHVVVTAAEHREATFDEVLAAGEVLEVKYRLERYTWDEEVVVYGEAREEVARQVITMDELRRVPGSFGDPIRALQSLPSVSRGTELSGDIIARGAEAFNSAAYVDGIRIPFLFHFLVGRSVIDGNQIEDIEFYPGAIPPRFGDVSQAVINARTNFDKAGPGLHGRVHVDLLEMGGSVATELGHDWTLRMGGRRAWITSVITAGAWTVRQVQGLNDPSYRPASIRVPYEDYLVRLVRNTGDHHFAVTWVGARDGIGIVPERTDRDGDGHHDPNPPNELQYDPNLLIDNRFFRLQARYDLTSDGHVWSTWVTGGRDRRQNLVPDLGLIGASGIQFAQTESGWLNVGHDSKHPLSESLELRVGGEVVAQPSRVTQILALQSDPENATTFATKAYAGPFAELAFHGDAYRITPGLRVSAHHLVGGWTVVPEPRLSARFALSDRWSVVGYSGLLSQGPSIEQIAAGYTARNLEVVRAGQSTVGLEARWPNGLGIDISVYETEMWNLVLRDIDYVVAVAPDTDISTGGGGYYNEDRQEPATLLAVPRYSQARGRAYGVEAQLRLKPHGPQFGWLAGSVGRSFRYTDSETTRADADIPFNLVAVYGFGLPKGWTISGRGQFASGLVYTPQVGAFASQYDYWESYDGDRNSERYPLYRRFDVRIDKTWEARRARWTFYLDVYNATNAHNPLFATYNWNYTELTTQAYVPILPTFGLEVSY